MNFPALPGPQSSQLSFGQSGTSSSFGFSGFGGGTGFGGFGAGAQSFSQTQFGQQSQLMPFQQQQQQQQQSSSLVTTEGKPASHSTKFEDLSQGVRNSLLKLECAFIGIFANHHRSFLTSFLIFTRQEVLRHRDEARKLERSELLQGAPGREKSLKEETSSLAKSLQQLAEAFEADIDSLEHVRGEVLGLMRDTEGAVGTFRRAKERMKGQSEPAGGPPSQPPPFFQQAAERMEGQLTELERPVEDLEQAFSSTGDEGFDRDESSVTPASLERALSNVHSYLVHVAAQVERVHSRVEAAQRNTLHF